jgi:hypothetical protein
MEGQILMPHVFNHTPTEQEIFDAACRYFATTEGPSSVKRSYGDACKYREKDTCRECIAGHFIPDDSYDPAMDDLTLLAEYKGGGAGIENLLVYFGAKLPSWFRTHLVLLNRLQKIHDGTHNWTDVRGWNYANVVTMLTHLADYLELDHSAIKQVKARRVPAGWQSVEA